LGRCHFWLLDKHAGALDVATIHFDRAKCVAEANDDPKEMAIAYRGRYLS
jgi:hypothetical protein